MYEKTAKWMDTAVSSAHLCDLKKKFQSTNTERHVHLFVMNVMQRLKSMVIRNEMREILYAFDPPLHSDVLCHNMEEQICHYFHLITNLNRFSNPLKW